MSSLTKKTEKVRDRKAQKGGRRRKNKQSAHSTPAFPIQPEGYDPKAPDGKASQ